MLVLNRTPSNKTESQDESILRIGDDIIIHIVLSNHKSVKLGIEAPDHIGIWREEVYKKIKEAKQRKLG
jgi:carbon storage regulator CsrA